MKKSFAKSLKGCGKDHTNDGIQKSNRFLMMIDSCNDSSMIWITLLIFINHFFFIWNLVLQFLHAFQMCKFLSADNIVRKRFAVWGSTKIRPNNKAKKLGSCLICYGLVTYILCYTDSWTATISTYSWPLIRGNILGKHSVLQKGKSAAFL